MSAHSLRSAPSLAVRVAAIAAVCATASVGRVLSQAPVEIGSEHPAAVVRVHDASYLVHELWVTNRAPSPLTLTEVTVLDGAHTLTVHQQPQLALRVGRPGLPRRHPTPLRLDPHQPVVVFFWDELPADRAAPRQVRHRVSLRPMSADADLVIEGGITDVAPAGASEILDAPLKGRGWVAVYDPLLVGGHRTAVYTIDGRRRIPGRFAIDWIRLLPNGRLHTDGTSRPPDWNGFGAEVLAAKDARVAVVVDGRPDADAHGKPREAITPDNAAGNYVVLDLGNGRFAFYEHLQRGSVNVSAGQHVSRGETIARVGSSGSVSAGPHLHFHVGDAASPLDAEGLPFVLRRFQLLGAFATLEAFARGGPPVPTAAGGAAARAFERPGPNVVLDFEP